MIGNAVETYRKVHGFTQAEMAAMLEISRNYLSQIERREIDEGSLSLGIYRRICNYVGWPNEPRQETLAELFTEMYTAYMELAGSVGCDDCMTYANKWLARYTAVTGHVLRP